MIRSNVNDFLINRMNEALKRVGSGKYKSQIASQFFAFNAFGVNDENSLKKYHYLSQCVPSLVKIVCGNYNQDISYKVIKHAMDNFDENLSVIDIREIVSKAFSELKLIKFAYPNIDGEIEQIKKYDINKWITALNDIYVKSKLFGSNKKEIINQITAEWGCDMQEKMDFERWVKFHQNSGSRMYKSAQNYSMLPIQAIPGLSPKNNEMFVDDNFENNENPTIKKTRKQPNLKERIVRKITSIERLLADNIDKIGDVKYEQLLDVLIKLRNQILLLKTSCMIEDMVIRAQNTLIRNGADEHVMNLFSKIAQLPPMPEMGGADPSAASGAPNTGEPADPEAGKKAILGFVAGLKKAAPNTPDVNLEEAAALAAPGTPEAQAAPEAAKPTTPAPVAPTAPTAPSATPAPAAPKAPKATPAPSIAAKPAAPAAPAVSSATKSASYNWANINTPELKKFEKVAGNILKLASNAKDHLVILAQEAPNVAPTNIPAPAAPAPVPTTTPVPATDVAGINEQESISPKKKREMEKIVPEKTPRDALLLNIEDDIMEKALAGITLPDVIKRLQALSRVFKNREIARQLAFIDILLDKFGISGFFPALAEATRSALESNQYCQTRVEEVLSKLTSAIDEKGSSLLSLPENPAGADSIVDREMDSYMNEGKAKPKEEVAAPVVEPVQPVEQTPNAAI